MNLRRYVLSISFLVVPLFLFGSGLTLFFMGPNSREIYPLRMTRFAGSIRVYSHERREWATLTRSNYRTISIVPRDCLSTGEESDLDFKMQDAIDFRLRPSSELEILTSRSVSPGKELKLRLTKGSLLGKPVEHTQNLKLQIKTPVFMATIPQAHFFIQADRSKSSVSVLDGMVEVNPTGTRRKIKVNHLETLEVALGKRRALPKPKRLSQEEWKVLREMNEFALPSPEKVAQQLDLRKEAGSLFRYVFDEGVFYKPDWGYANREFYRDEETKEVVLRVDYDVFPKASYSGLYFKSRGLDLSKVARFSVRAKADSERPIPSQFRIEWKDRFSIVRGFSVKPITRDWRLYSFDFLAQKETPVSELVFVFENTRVGPMSSSGTVFLKELNIE